MFFVLLGLSLFDLFFKMTGPGMFDQ